MHWSGRRLPVLWRKRRSTDARLIFRSSTGADLFFTCDTRAERCVPTRCVPTCERICCFIVSSFPWDLASVGGFD